MLERTFIHCPGIGAKSEQRLWDQGCDSWSCYLNAAKPYSVGSASREDVRAHLEKSVEALNSGEHQYFAKRLRLKHAWRAYRAFSNSCVFLDIETDGTNRPSCVTTIGMYDGRDYRCLVQGEDLESFRDLITHYSMIVTFFGSGFDLPVLQKRFRGLEFDQIHLDLCPTLRDIGYKGGLKKIEKEFGIERSESTQGLTGLDAVYLWRRYRYGSAEALETLIAYNREDVVNMKTIADQAFPALVDSLTNRKAAPEGAA